MDNSHIFCKKFLGMSVSQNIYAPHTFDTFFKNLNNNGEIPARVIEIGTSGGGLSILIGMYCYHNNIPFTTYDIHDGVGIKHKNLFSVMGIKFIVKDIFDAVDDVSNEIKKEGISILLCDGGNKKKEFNVFATSLKKGDYIFAHDYAENNSVFNDIMRNKLWNWLQIEDKDIKDACLNNNLTDFMKTEFNRCAWTCKVKI